MYCPKCNLNYDDSEGVVCGQCGSPLVPSAPSSSGAASINLDGSAVSGGIHTVDSHNITTTNNITHIEAAKSVEALMFESENRFIEAVQKRFATGNVDNKDIAELNQFAITCHVSPERAAQIIDQVRRNSSKVQSSKGNEFLEQQMAQEIIAAISQNQVEVLKNRMQALKSLAHNTQDGTIHYLNYMLQASLSPESSTIDILNANTDNYWQIFWAYVAYLKVGDMDRATALLPRIGAFGAMQGDMSLLMALSNVAEYAKRGFNDYYRDQAQQHLEQSMAAGMSELLHGLWAATSIVLQENEQPENWCRFYAEQTLKEFVGAKAPKLPDMQVPPPPTKQFNAQEVNLSQMQGFNPLQAAQQMGIGTCANMNGMNMGSMPQMPNMGMPQMPNIGTPPMPGMGSMPQMPNMGMPQMPGMGSMPQMPNMGTSPMSGMTPPVMPNNEEIK